MGALSIWHILILGDRRAAAVRRPRQDIRPDGRFRPRHQQLPQGLNDHDDETPTYHAGSPRRRRGQEGPVGGHPPIGSHVATFSWSHILLLLIVALVVVGPKDLPKLMRMMGRWMGKARAMANQLRKSFDDMARQSELDELRAEIEALRHQRSAGRHRSALHQSGRCRWILAQRRRARGKSGAGATRNQRDGRRIADCPSTGGRRAVMTTRVAGRRSRYRGDESAAARTSGRTAQAPHLVDRLVRCRISSLLRVCETDICLPDRAAGPSACRPAQPSSHLHRAARNLLHLCEGRHVRRTVPGLFR